jgi:hypothetical protein
MEIICPCSTLSTINPTWIILDWTWVSMETEPLDLWHGPGLLLH